MKLYIQIKLSSGQTYQISSTVIANHRASAMLEEHPDEFFDHTTALAATVKHFADPDNMREWATTRMTPDDYVPYGLLVAFDPPARDFNAAEWSYHDEEATIPEISGDNIMNVPLEAALTSMWSSGQLCNVSVLNASDGKPFAAVAMILGHESVLQPYLNTLTDLTAQIEEALKKQNEEEVAE